ncbi:MAG: hypothetical protein KA313_03390 [Pseudarcicella sp.]|nr:hypothetical protein [Pseudarcicella sp.]
MENILKQFTAMFFIKNNIPTSNVIRVSLATVIFFFSFDFLTFSQCTGCTIQATANGNYNLNSGDVLCIPAGQTFTGSIGNLPSGSKICISNTAIFSPNQINNATGKIDNYGTANFPGFSLSTGFELNNYKTIFFMSSVNWNGAANFFNASGATMNFNNNFSLKNNSTFINEGDLIGLSDFETENGTTLINRAFIKTVGGNFNPNGTVNNMGSIVSEKFININSNARITNECSMVADRGFNNNSPYTINNGYFVVTGKYGFPDDLWQNNQVFTQGPNGTVTGVRFFNLSTIQGKGNFYFTGDTRNQGSFGQDAQGMNFYDTTPTGSQIMDVISPSPHASVTKNSFLPPTATQYNAGGCSGIINPVVASNDSSYFNYGTTVNLSILTNDNSGSPLDLTSVSLVPTNTATNIITDSNGDVVSFTIADGIWSVNQNGVVTFASTSSQSPTPINYSVKNESGTISNNALITLFGSPLAMKILKFEANLLNNTVQIRWKTNDEKANYEIQKSKDSKHFETIGFMPSNANYSYVFEDNELSTLNYYRLKSEDENGKIDFSKIIVLQTNEFRTVTINPTLVEDKIKLKFKNGIKAQSVFLYNNKGVLIKKLDSEIEIHDLSMLPKSFYFIKIQTTDLQSTTVKLFKK